MRKAREAGLGGLGPESAVFSVIRGIKMAAASPQCWGRGAVSYFAVALQRGLAAAILGWRAGRAARGTKWRQSRASTRASQGYLVRKRRARSLGSYTGIWIKKGRLAKAPPPPGWNLVCSWGLLLGWGELT